MMNTTQATSPLAGAMNKIFNDINHQLLYSGRVSREVIQFNESQWYIHGPRLHDQLASQAIGGEVSSHLIENAIKQFIDQCYSMYQQQYSGGNMPIGGSSWGQPQQSTFGGGWGNQPNTMQWGSQQPVRQNADIYGSQDEPTVEPIVTEDMYAVKTTKIETPQPPYSDEPDEPYREPTFGTITAGELSAFDIPGSQKCRSGYLFKMSNGKDFSFLSFELKVPESNTRKVLDIFKDTNPQICNKSSWIVDLLYYETIVIDERIDRTKNAIAEVAEVFRDEGWAAAEACMKTQSHQFYTLMEKVLVTEINHLLDKYVQLSNVNVPGMKIGALSDIEFLYNNELPSYTQLVDNDTYESTIDNVIAKAFGKYFGKNTRALNVPDDIPLISRCDGIVFRKAGFTEITPVADMTNANGEIDSVYLDTFKSKTVLLVRRRALFTNMAPKAFLKRLSNPNVSLHKVTRHTNVLDTVVGRALDHHGGDFDLYIDSTKHGMSFEIGIGRSMDDAIVYNTEK